MLDDLGNMLKDKYEDVSRYVLPQRTHIILRIDGRAFHSFTRRLPRPYCQELMDAMDAAAKAVCKDAMGCHFAYGQSDEYSFLLTDFEREATQMWFGGNIQKICSVAASVFTANFNFAYQATHEKRHPAVFDCRVFSIPPRIDVEQYFIWRQTDAARNSLNMFASCHFSHQELMGRNSSDKHDMLHTKGLNWNDCSTDFKRGRVVRKVGRERQITFTHKKTRISEVKLVQETVWDVDHEIPIFNRERDYLDDLILQPFWISAGQ